MAHHKAALKSIRQDKKRNLRNRFYKTRLHTEERKLRELVQKGELPAIQEILVKNCSLIDHTASKGVIHKRRAARKKSRLTKLVNRLQAQQQKKEESEPKAEK